MVKLNLRLKEDATVLSAVINVLYFQDPVHGKIKYQGRTVQTATEGVHHYDLASLVKIKDKEPFVISNKYNTRNAHRYQFKLTHKEMTALSFALNELNETKTEVGLEYTLDLTWNGLLGESALSEQYVLDMNYPRTLYEHVRKYRFKDLSFGTRQWFSKPF